MNVSVRSHLTAGAAALTAATLAFVPAVPEPTQRAVPTSTSTVRTVSAPVRLAAVVQPTTPLPKLLTDWLPTVLPSSAGAAKQTAAAPSAAGSIDNGIKNVYNAVEPWVRYGFELATYAVGWVPVVGWLAPQIMIFYNFGERITRSVTFNLADVLGGNISLLTGLRNVTVDTINSFITLANDELAFFLPPLPPIPPIGGLAAAAPTLSKASDAVPNAGQRPWAARAGRVDGGVPALPRPREALSALKAALDQAHTDRTVRLTATNTAATDTAVAKSRTPAALEKFVKRLASRATTEQPKQSAAPTSQAKRTDPKATSGRPSADGPKDRGARQVKAGAPA